MKIQLTKGYETIIDNSDAWVTEWKWYAHDTGDGRYIYAERKIKGNQRIQLHRLIMDCPKEMTVDHIDGDTLNNKRANLRIGTKQQNVFNQQKQSGRTSIFKGVHWFKRGGKWSAYITINQKQKHLGYFENESDAARAYDAAAVTLFGEFAKLNFPA